jgi:hypothetical protein
MKIKASFGEVRRRAGALKRGGLNDHNSTEGSQKCHHAASLYLGPWSIFPGGFRVQDATGNPLCYFYAWDDPSAGHQADVLTRDEALHMAANFAMLPELLKRSDGDHPAVRPVANRVSLGLIF